MCRGGGGGRLVPGKGGAVVTTVSSQAPDATPRSRGGRTRFVVHEMWAALAVAVMLARRAGGRAVRSGHRLEQSGVVHPHPVGRRSRLLRLARHVGRRAARLRSSRRRRLTITGEPGKETP